MSDDNLEMVYPDSDQANELGEKILNLFRDAQPSDITATLALAQVAGMILSDLCITPKSWRRRHPQWPSGRRGSKAEREVWVRAQAARMAAREVAEPKAAIEPVTHDVPEALPPEETQL